MTGPTVGVLALQGGVREHADVVESLGGTVRLVRRPDHLDRLDALIVPGGESTAIARLARGSGLLTQIGERIDAGLPVLGTCAGLILLAREVVDADALAGFPTIARLDVTVRRNAYGAQAASGEREVVLVDGDSPGSSAAGSAAPGSSTQTSARVSFIRAPMIEAVGDGVEVIALDAARDATHDTAREGDTPVSVQQGNVIGCSFHPELTGETVFHERLLACI